jgi:uncharacterized protein involved in outer membrane biogenesis
LSKRVRYTGIALITLVVVVIIGAMLFDWNAVRGIVAQQVSERTGRSFAINGDLDVAFFPLSVRADDVVLGNASWGSHAAMAHIDQLGFELRFWPLFTGRVVLPEITLVHPDVLLEVNANGERNWEFEARQRGKQPGGAGAMPAIGRLTIKNGLLRYRDPTVTTDLRVAMNTEAQAQEPVPLLAVRGEGRYKGEPFVLRGHIGSLLGLRNRNEPYPVDLHARAGATQATAKGTLVDPFYLTGVDIDLTLKGSDMSKLHPIVGLPIPATPPYDVSGHLRHEKRTWRFANFRGKAGNSDLAGNLAVDTGGARPALRGDLTSRHLDMTDLAGFIGANPGKSAEQQRERERQRQQATLLPDTPFNLEKLNSLDANVQFKGEQIKTRLPLDHLATHLILKGGVLTLQPLTFGVASGQVAGNVKLDARGNRIRSWADIEMQHLLLQRLMPATRYTKPAEGTLGGRVKLTATGNSLAQMASNADGKIGLVTSGGKVSNLLLAFSKIDIPQVLKLLLGNDKDATLNCAVADFNVDNGLLETQTMVVDAKDTQIVGAGTIQLQREQLDMTMRARPKSTSALTTPSPVTIKGTFKQPDISVAKGPLIGRAAAALGLGILAGPVAALAPLVSGPAKSSPCAQLVQDVRKDMGTAATKR